MNQFLEECRKNLCEHGYEDSFEARRIFHGRGKYFKGLESITVDYIHPVFIFRNYDVDFNETQLIEDLLKLVNENDSCLVLKKKNQVGRFETTLISGSLPEKVIAKENGLSFEIDVLSNQNIGLFLDMKEGKRLVRKLASNKNVLNLFSYTCSISIHALSVGANKVVNIDMSRGALKFGKINHKLNEIESRKVTFLDHDIFKSFGKLKKAGPYDLIISDPPSRQGKSFDFKKDYAKILRKADEFIVDGGDVLCCLNSPFCNLDEFKDLINENCPRLIVNEVYFSPKEFKEVNKESGLKIIHCIAKK